MFKVCIFVVSMLASVSAYAQVLEPVIVTASSHYDIFVPENAADKLQDTTWRAFGKGQWIQYDLGEPLTFNSIRIAWHAGFLRQANFRVAISSNGVDFTEVWDDVSSGTTKYFEQYLIMDHTARYVRITGNGNNKNDWNSISEIEIRNDVYPNTIWAADMITASSYQDPNIPDNAEDWLPETRWSALGKGQWLKYDLYEDKPVSEIEILWYQASKTRRTTFVIDVKADGQPWTRVFSGQSNGSSTYEVYLLPEMVSARYVRVTGYGNTLNLWNSISEMHVWGYSPEWD